MSGNQPPTAIGFLPFGCPTWPHTRPPVRTSIASKFSRYHPAYYLQPLTPIRTAIVLPCMSFWFRFIKVSSALSRSGSIPLAGLSSARPLSFFIVPHLSGYVRCIPSLKLLIHFPPFFPWAPPPLGYILRRSPWSWFHSCRSYLSESFGSNSAVQTCQYGSPSLRYSLVRLRVSGLFQYFKERSHYCSRPAATNPLLRPAAGLAGVLWVVRGSIHTTQIDKHLIL